MKKILYSLMAIFAAVTLTSCEDFEPGGTATEKLSGNWMCTIYGVNADGESEMFAGSEFITYNTAANDVDKMWIDDDDAFWGVKSKIDCDVNALAFGKEGAEYEELYYDSMVNVWNGKVTFDGAIAPASGAKCDKIEFYLDIADMDYLNSNYGTDYDFFYVAGYRRTGFTEDDDEFIEDWTLPTF